MGNTNIAVFTNTFPTHSINYAFQLQIVRYLTNYNIGKVTFNTVSTVEMCTVK